MDMLEVIATTRAIRRYRPDPIPEDVQARMLDAAVRAPSGGNTQGWRFLLVDDPGVKARLGPLYRTGTERLWAEVYPDRVAAEFPLDRFAPGPGVPSFDLTALQAHFSELLHEFFRRVAINADVPPPPTIPTPV